ncbi:leucine rich repeat domain-containing protein [Suillus subluteus]|nr:leucine rich repeat domain-containing protein [Suillus subluteus]
MEPQPGDDYLRGIATFIRDNEMGLAEAGFVRRRRIQRRHSSNNTSVFNLAGWFSYDSQTPPPAPPPKPVTFTIDTHRLFYILMRLEALGIDIGTLDVRVDNPSKPMHYTHIDLYPNSDNSDSLSLASFRSSLSAVSGLSLGVGWWGRQEPQTIDEELKYIYSSFTKLPALSITAPGPKVIAELADEPPNQNALPLDAFKNIQTLECVDIDPRTLLGWDRLAESLRSLTVQRSGLEDVTDIFIGAVLDDQARRDGTTSDSRSRRIPRSQRSFQSTRLPESVPEDDEDDLTPPVPSPGAPLSPYKWSLLKHLSLADNALTFLPTDPLPYLTSLSYLDLSSNLLVSVPHGIATLHNLVSLNLSDNMIDSVLGIYTHLGQVLNINLSRNRLESICGLERLMALERVDLRSNHIEESAEIGRLATLPNIAEVWIEGNPLTEYEDNYRTACFDLFLKEDKNIKLDGASPGFYEKRSLSASLSDQPLSINTVETLPSPPVVPVGSPKAMTPSSTVTHDATATPRSGPSSPSHGSSPLTGAVAGKRKRKVKRIVDLSPVDGTDGQSYSSNKGGTVIVPGISVDSASSLRSSSATVRILRPHSTNGKSSHRRVSTVFDPPDEGQSQSQIRDAELYRARMQALRSDMGDGWLKVFSQSQKPSPGVAAG